MDAKTDMNNKHGNKKENDGMNHDLHKTGEHFNKYEMNTYHQDMHHNKHVAHNHRTHNRMMIADFKKRFVVSLILSVPIVLLSPMIQSLLNFQLTFKGQTYVLFVLSVLVYFYGGWPFLKGIVDEIKEKSPGMMTLISLAITVAFLYSSAVVFGFEGKLFFWELATLIDIMLLGHWIEMHSILDSSKALEKLSQLIPDIAHIKKNNKVWDIPVSALLLNDTVLVKPGEKIPSDGRITKGETFIDESMLTGESLPVQKKVDNNVIAGSVNGLGSIEIVVSNTGEASYISKVIRMVQEAQLSKSRTQRLADRAAKWLTLASITLGIGAFFGWLAAGSEIAFAIERLATVMIITCPHSLGLAIPLVIAVSTAQSAKKGLLIRNRTAFEMSRRISIVVFDKTGTLTKGDFGVTGIDSLNKDFSVKTILRYAASVESRSEHPIATGILKKAEEENISLTEAEDAQAIKGKGISGVVENKKISIVSPAYLNQNRVNIPESIVKKKALLYMSLSIIL